MKMKGKKRNSTDAEKSFDKKNKPLFVVTYNTQQTVREKFP